MYKVEEILDKRIEPKTKKFQYLIKWEGYEVDVSTWEPVEHLQYCIDMIEDFEEKYGHLHTTSTGTLHLHHADSHQTKKSRGHKKQIPKALIKQQPIFQSQEGSQQKNASPKQKRKILTNHVKKPIDLKLGGAKSKEEKDENIRQFDAELDSINKKIREKAQKGKGKDIPKEHFLRIRGRREKEENLSEESSIFKKLRKPISKKNDLKEKKKSKDGSRISQNERSESGSIRPKKRTQRYKKAQKERQQPEKGKVIGQTHKIEQNLEKEKDEIIEIVGMRRVDETFEFFLKKGDIEGWSSHQFVLDNYPRQLCGFYEKNIEFD